MCEERNVLRAFMHIRSDTLSVIVRSSYSTQLPHVSLQVFKLIMRDPLSKQQMHHELVNKSHAKFPIIVEKARALTQTRVWRTCMV